MSDTSIPTTPSRVIADMRRLLGEPPRWTKGFEACDGAGLPVDACSPAAVCWCLYGSLARSLSTIPDQATRDALAERVEAQILATARRTRPALLELAPLNDDRATTHAEICELLDKSYASSMSASGSEPEPEPGNPAAPASRS